MQQGRRPSPRWDDGVNMKIVSDVSLRYCANTWDSLPCRKLYWISNILFVTPSQQIGLKSAGARVQVEAFRLIYSSASAKVWWLDLPTCDAQDLGWLFLLPILISATPENVQGMLLAFFDEVMQQVGSATSAGKAGELSSIAFTVNCDAIILHHPWSKR